MSDHISGPRAIADPVADITDTYAFPSPESPQNLVLIMNVFPFAGLSALFSDAVIYRFRIRPAAIDSADAPSRSEPRTSHSTLYSRSRSLGTANRWSSLDDA
jgi:hypothetical protein